MLKNSWPLVCLTICVSCSVAKPVPTPAPVIYAPAIPAEYLKQPPGRYTGPLDTTGDLVTRGTVAEASLKACIAQVDAIRAWNNETQALASPTTVR
jgi:hypothetical protein